ncbi:MAG: STAS domain-containing protein [Phycisphaerae bacterium]|nr:STAS domain-containing protein [Phycisphaerae bacterium]
MALLSLSLEEQREGLVVRVRGDATDRSLGLLNQELERVAQRRPRVVVVDLGGATRISNAALGSVLALRDTLGRARSDVRVAVGTCAGGGGCARTALSEANINPALSVFGTVEEALKG